MHQLVRLCGKHARPDAADDPRHNKARDCTHHERLPLTLHAGAPGREQVQVRKHQYVTPDHHCDHADPHEALDVGRQVALFLLLRVRRDLIPVLEEGRCPVGGAERDNERRRRM